MTPYLLSYTVERVDANVNRKLTIWLAALALVGQGLSMPLGGLGARKIGFRPIVAISCIVDSNDLALHESMEISADNVYLFPIDVTHEEVNEKYDEGEEEKQELFGQEYIFDDQFLSGVATASSVFNALGRVAWGAIADRASFKSFGSLLCGLFNTFLPGHIPYLAQFSACAAITLAGLLEYTERSPKAHVHKLLCEKRTRTLSIPIHFRDR
ncbi:hypothetical protein T265_07709 [Opisthorchis viverrini]|uniref:Uncharacterized protein n=1 Tax=Opisthorchis viverrini TaxID=6198 RepID=A0A074ZBL8_OPIVI|nr:hypothetical protein T265_07709 [Opisthorchis viverrini]KER24661.1 hypothetical protein T265_07709 [Opisthorchis viverrini]